MKPLFEIDKSFLTVSNWRDVQRLSGCARVMSRENNTYRHEATLNQAVIRHAFNKESDVGLSTNKDET